jgi:phosphate transport system protein
MRIAFDKQLDLLNEELTTMGNMCETAINYAMQGLFCKDLEMAKKAVDSEKEIDQKEKDIESLCMKLLLQQQPVARDLRKVSSALKMISDMERIGDQAEDIAEILETMKLDIALQEKNLCEMANAATLMVKQSIESFVKKDLDLANKVIEDDDIVDNYFEEVRKDLIKMISENADDGEQYIDLLMIAKYLERIADHATNIAEWVVYSITGTHAN